MNNFTSNQLFPKENLSFLGIYFLCAPLPSPCASHTGRVRTSSTQISPLNIAPTTNRVPRVFAECPAKQYANFNHRVKYPPASSGHSPNALYSLFCSTKNIAPTVNRVPRAFAECPGETICYLLPRNNTFQHTGRSRSERPPSGCALLTPNSLSHYLSFTANILQQKRFC